jgi:hypothetical protein
MCEENFGELEAENFGEFGVMVDGRDAPLVRPNGETVD